ncbi:MAG: peptidoglycan DD-metalloendopeptidase family protein [Bacillota bacterium]
MKNRKFIIISVVAMLLVAAAAFSLNTGQKWSNAHPRIAYKVLLNGKTWFHVQDQTKLEEILNDYKNQYVSKIDRDAAIKSVDFKQRIDIVEVNNYSGDLLSWSEVRKTIHSNAEEASLIEVKDGDNLWTISQDLGLSVDEILALNPGLTEETVIYPGDKITVKAEKPVLDVVIVYEITVMEDVPFTTEFINDANMYQSQRRLESQGVLGKAEKTYRVTVENNMEVERTTLQTKTISAPVPAKVRVGTKKAVSRSGSNFGVVSGGRLSSNFGNRVHPVTGKSRFHKGVDIAAARGNPVFAYASGTVTYAGWMSGYGNLIAISHGNGMVTRYGHLSAIYVKAGQKVSVRQRIGAVGSTGVSTGPHLHFEVLINGSFKNPLNYL